MTLRLGVLTHNFYLLVFFKLYCKAIISEIILSWPSLLVGHNSLNGILAFFQDLASFYQYFSQLLSEIFLVKYTLFTLCSLITEVKV